MRAKQSLDHCCLFLYFYISKSTTIHPPKLALFGMRLNIIVQNKFKFQKQACMPQLPHVLVLPTSLLVAKYSLGSRALMQVCQHSSQQWYPSSMLEMLSFSCLNIKIFLSCTNQVSQKNLVRHGKNKYFVLIVIHRILHSIKTKFSCNASQASS